MRRVSAVKCAPGIGRRLEDRAAGVQTNSAARMHGAQRNTHDAKWQRRRRTRAASPHRRSSLVLSSLATPRSLRASRSHPLSKECASLGTARRVSARLPARLDAPARTHVAEAPDWARGGARSGCDWGQLERATIHSRASHRGCGCDARPRAPCRLAHPSSGTARCFPAYLGVVRLGSSVARLTCCASGTVGMCGHPKMRYHTAHATPPPFRASLVLLPPPAGAARRSATYLVDAFPFEGGALQACVRLLMTPARSARARGRSSGGQGRATHRAARASPVSNRSGARKRHADCTSFFTFPRKPQTLYPHRPQAPRLQIFQAREA